MGCLGMTWGGVWCFGPNTGALLPCWLMMIVSPRSPRLRPKDLDSARAHDDDYDSGDCQEYYHDRSVDASGAGMGLFESQLEVVESGVNETVGFGFIGGLRRSGRKMSSVGGFNI